MKYLKLIYSLIFIIAILFGINQFVMIQNTKNDYKKYYTENADIQILLSGGNHSLSSTSYYPEKIYYESAYNEVVRLYKNISKEKIIPNFELSNFIPVNIKYHENYHYKDLHRCIDENHFINTNQQIVEGRMFTQEEIKQGSHVIILHEHIIGNTDIPWDNEKIELGETVQIMCLNDSGELESFDFEVIGFYKFQENNSMQDVYIPSSTIKNLSNTWMNNQNGKMYEDFYPMGIVNPIFQVNSEEEVDAIEEVIQQYIKGASFRFEISRLDNHEISEKEFDTSKYEEKLIKTILFLVAIVILFFGLERIQLYIKKKEENKFSMLLSNEQEKNVQTIFLMNQESHKLKHDLKHLFNQLSFYVRNNELDKALELMDEYHNEIISLDIPAYTQNGTVDMLLNHYIQLAKMKNINFTFFGNLLPDLEISDRKLYILLSNALENAFLHCDERKNVKLTIGHVKPYCRFVITNTIDSKQEEKYEKGHGYGLISMRKIIREINGELTCEKENNIYICTILIPIKKKIQN